jgi:hypothetical protein
MSSIGELRAKEIEYCQEHPVYFVENYGHIEDRNKAEIIQPFALWKEQKEALEGIQSHKRTIILKARQLGISWLVLHYAAWMLVTMKGRLVIGLSKSETEAMELVRRIATVILRNMPELIAEKGNIPEGWTGAWFENTALVLKVHHPDGPDSTFQCFASSENAARSFTADLLIFDEWAFQQFDRSIWQAAYPVINRANSGQVIGVSTIKRGSLFEELYTTENNFYKIFIPWSADPSRDEKWYAETKKEMGDLMQSEYPASVEEALTVPGGAFFPEVTDDSILSEDTLKQNTVDYFVMDYGLDMLAGYFVKRDAFGNAQIDQEIYESNLTVSEAASLIRDLAKDYDVAQYLAPPDLWNRSPQTGKSIALLFGENGLNLTKVNNDIKAGCLALKEYLSHGDGGKSKLTIRTIGGKPVAPNLLRCLKKIQHDERKPNVYAKQPHELTHAVDAARYFAIYWTNGAVNELNEKRTRWREDQWEDYDNASPEDKAYLISMWGKPI